MAGWKDEDYEDLSYREQAEINKELNKQAEQASEHWKSMTKYDRKGPTWNGQRRNKTWER